jgi:hypothetical protein
MPCASTLPHQYTILDEAPSSTNNIQDTTKTKYQATFYFTRQPESAVESVLAMVCLPVFDCVLPCLAGVEGRPDVHAQVMHADVGAVGEVGELRRRVRLACHNAANGQNTSRRRIGQPIKGPH